MKELREFVEIMDNIAAGQPVVQEDAVDAAHLSDMLDELEEHLNQAVGLANDLARFGRDLPGPFAGQIRSYLAPHLESFIEDRRQPGSIASLRNILIDSAGGDEDEMYEDAQTFDHLTNSKLKRILMSGPKNIDELAWAMEFTQDALSDDYNDEMIPSSVYDARNRAYQQAEAVCQDEDGEFNPDADVDATLTHLRKFWSV